MRSQDAAVVEAYGAEAFRDFIAVRPGATMPKVCNAVSFILSVKFISVMHVVYRLLLHLTVLEEHQCQKAIIIKSMRRVFNGQSSGLA